MFVFPMMSNIFKLMTRAKMYIFTIVRPKYFKCDNGIQVQQKEKEREREKRRKCEQSITITTWAVKPLLDAGMTVCLCAQNKIRNNEK